MAANGNMRAYQGQACGTLDCSIWYESGQVLTTLPGFDLAHAGVHSIFLWCLKIAICPNVNDPIKAASHAGPPNGPLFFLLVFSGNESGC